MLKRASIFLLILTTLLAACSGPQVSTGIHNVTQVFPEPSPPAVATLSGYPAAGYPPLHSATASTPLAYPGQKLYAPEPTLDPTQAESTYQTAIAATTATTAALFQTATAEEASRPTSAAVATSTPVLEPTRIFVDSKPDCILGQPYMHCHDTVLAVDFDYPSEWGAISARYFTGSAGHGYAYDFGVNKAGQQAGGRSRDFSEARGLFLTDFSGFPIDPAGNSTLCAAYRAAICRVVQPQVVFMFSLPTAAIICQVSPNDYFTGMGLVAVNLPQGQKVNGFLFGMPVLSAKLSQELSVLLDTDPKAQLQKCHDAAARQQFDAKIKPVTAAIQAGTADPATQANIDQLMHLGQSITFD